jgi:hypothetical protein
MQVFLDASTKVAARHIYSKMLQSRYSAVFFTISYSA